MPTRYEMEFQIENCERLIEMYEDHLKKEDKKEYYEWYQTNIIECKERIRTLKWVLNIK